MSQLVARAALERMNMREVAIAAHCTTLASDLRELATANAESEQQKFLNYRSELCAAYGLEQPQQRKPFAFTSGLAIIPVNGTLINRFGSSWGWVTGYNFIRTQLALALADSDVTGIVLDVNSYGGEAAGCFELSSAIRAAREQKPVLAVVDSNAYSAGYAIASAATKVVCIPSGGVGSIGVVAMHVDMSQMLAEAGIKVTFIYESEHKIDGNPYQPLPDSVQKSMQASIHKSYEAFVSLVATNRGMDAQKVRDTKSQTYRADDALALGLIDAIATPQEAALAFLGELSGSDFQLQGASSMSTAQTNEPGAGTQAQANQAAAEQAAQNARVAERARVSSIMGCEEAKGREALASHFAMNTDMSVDQAKAALAVAPKAAAEAPTSTQQASSTNTMFQQAMDATGNPNVGADGAAGANGNAVDPVASILRAQELATGVKLDTK